MISHNDGSMEPVRAMEVTQQESRRDATEEDIEQFRHVVDTIPRAVWVALAVGASERFTYYAVSAPWRKFTCRASAEMPRDHALTAITVFGLIENYLQNKPGLVVPGELGLGQATATNIYNAYYFFSFLTPLLFAILSDACLGRFKTLALSSL
jgi:POT family proton-dependent oligopeptide transporter